MVSFRHDILLMMVFFKAPFFDLFFLPYMSDPLDDAIFKIGICGDDITLYSKFDEAFDLSQQIELASSKVEFELQDTRKLERGRKWLVDFNVAKT